MTNYASPATAEIAVPMSEDEFNGLGEMLARAGEEDRFHGLSSEWDGGGGYFYAEEGLSIEELPEDFLKTLGGYLTRASLPYLEFGVAYTCDKMRPGSHGGTFLRIMPDGSIAAPELVWPGDPRIELLRRIGEFFGEDFNDTTVVNGGNLTDFIVGLLPEIREALGLEAPREFRNHYDCPDCRHKWVEEWSATCDSTCPKCGARNISPARSEDI